MTILAGIDINDTKCAIILGKLDGDKVEILDKHRFLTPETPETTLNQIADDLAALLKEKGISAPAAIGITSNATLDSKKGLILSSLDFPNWNQIDVLKPFQERFNVPVHLNSEVNAGALAEWKWGAGRGFQNVIYLTFGKSMSAGLILNGQLYSGTNNLAGMVGHIRLDKDGPVGYGKAGSFGGYCSGRGIAVLAQHMAEWGLKHGQPPLYCPTPSDLLAVTADKVGEAAQKGDETALDVFEIVGHQLGRALSVLIDLLNPERIIISGLYNRHRSLLEPITLDAMRDEALPQSVAVCQVVPDELGETMTDLASLAVALNALGK